MKRLLGVMVLILGAVCVISAQQWGNRRGYSQSITVTGTLQLQNGTIAVVNGNNVYYVPSLERYIGFIEGLKEGAQVSMDGYISGNGNYIQPAKVTINGKSYDFLIANNPGEMPYNNYGRKNTQYGGCGGGGWCW